MAGNPDDAAKAVIEDGAIVIRLPIANLQAVMDGGFACNVYDRRYRITDLEAFAKDVTVELDKEDDEGTTAIHKLFDAAMDNALNAGTAAVEEHPVQEF